MDRKTYCTAEFNFIDVTALADSRPVSTAAKDFSNMELFHKDVRQAAYGTMELNQFVLDGSREIFPDSQPEDVPFWSDEKSDADCRYVKNPVLEVSFSENHSSIGLTLYFADDIPSEVHIAWYTLFGTKLYDKVFYPDKREYFCKCNVENYGKVVIEATRSSLPYRYTKMDHIQYGQMWRLGNDNMKSARILEEIDATSATVSSNTATVELIDEADEFDTTDNNGLWKSLQKEQTVAFTEYIDGRAVDCGMFFLEKWSSQKNLVKFELVDRIGLMDKTKFYDGMVYDGIPAGKIIDAVMKSCGVKKYEVGEDVAATVLSGWLAIQSHREALQQVAFACGALVDDRHSDTVRIYRQSRHIGRTIGGNRKFTGTKVTLDDYVSAVTISYKQYVQAAETSEISSSILAAGRRRIEFNDPYVPESITVSVGSIAQARTNYVIVDMPEEKKCVISGRKYEAVENAYTAKVKAVAAGENEKEKSYKGCTLVDAKQVRAVAENILEYLQLRQIVEMKYISNGEEAGSWCDVGMAGGRSATTCITSQTLDLTGGHIATAKCRGYCSTVTSYYFCGDELYAGEEGMI